MDVRDDFIAVHGARHRVRLIDGDGDAGPMLVLLHEGLGSIPQWRDFPRRLAAATGLSIMVYERRNHGRSDPLGEPRGRRYHAQEAAILDAALDRLGVERVVSYGHSDGATIALLHAAIHPDRVAAVVSEAGHVVVEDVARRGVEHAKERYRAGLREALVRHHGDHTDAMFSAWADTWLDPMFDDWDITAELSTVTAPVLVLQGEHDEYATPDHIDWIAEAVSGPAETWILDGVGHAPHREAEAIVIGRVVEFLGTHGVA